MRILKNRGLCVSLPKIDSDMEYSTDYFAGLVEGALADLAFPDEAPRLFDPVRYTLEGGGKRLRPSMTLAAFAAFGGGDPAEVLPQALAVEMFHNFTLLHDDVMDNADIRRGRPTVHRRWNQNVAILSGDAMLTAAVQLLAQCRAEVLPDILRLFNDTAMEVYAGQQLDMEFERRTDVTVEEYVNMIRLKTSVLLACACAIGARMADASPEDAARLYQYGLYLGLAFQLRDDWLDTYGDPAMFGKEIGGDIKNRKKTWLLITAMNERGDAIDDILKADLNEDELVAQVRAVYDELNLGERCNALAEEYTAKAVETLEGLPIDDRAREYFTSLALKVTNRSH